MLYPNKTQSSVAFLFAVIALLLIGFLQSFLNPSITLWINELVIFLVPILIFLRGKDVSWREVCRFKPVSPQVFRISLVIGFAAFPVSNVLSTIVEVLLIESFGPLTVLTTFMETVSSGGFTFFLFITGVAFLAPIFEELFFRGFLQSGFGGYNTKSGWVLTGFLFGAVHFGNNISNAVGATFLGLILSYTAFTTGSIWPTIIIHGLINSLAAFLFHIPNYFGFSLALDGIFSPITVGLSITILMIALKRLPKTKADEISVGKFSFKAIIPLVIGLLIISVVPIAEINMRINAPEPLESSSISAATIDHGLVLATFEIDETTNLNFTYDIVAGGFNAELSLQNSLGEELWSRTEQGMCLSFCSDQTIENIPPGTYDLVLIGSARDLEAHITWEVE